MHTPIEQLAAPLFMSYFFNWVLFGVLTAQVYSYHVAFRKKDQLILRSVVYFTYALEVTHTFLLMVTGYNTFVKRFGDVSALTSWHGGGWAALPVIGSAVQSIAQNLYAYRIWTLRGSVLVPAVIMALVVAQFGGVVGITVHLRNLGPTDKYPNPTSYALCGVWVGCGVICDVVIACAMLLSLRKRDTKMQGTLDIISKLVHIIVWTGSFSAILTILTLIFLCVPQFGAYYLTTSAMISKAYSCSMLVLLNSRMEWRDTTQRTNETLEIMRFSSTDHGDKSSPAHVHRSRRSTPIRVDTTTHTIQD